MSLERKYSDETIKIQHIGLKNDIHLFEFQLDEQFFVNYEQSLVKTCALTVYITFNKKATPYHTKIQIDGTIDADCDRCNAKFPLRILTEYEVYIKYTDEHSELDESETEIIFITRDEPEIDLTKLVYDLVHLSIPIHKTCDDSSNGQKCDTEMLKMIDNYLQENAETKENEIDPRWEKLKNLKDKLN